MGKLSDFFTMSKQERVGAWMISMLIVALLVAMIAQRKCASDDITSSDVKSLNEYVEKAEKSKPKEKKKERKSGHKKTSKKESLGTGKPKGKKANNQEGNKATKSKSKSQSKDNDNKQKRELQPVPQF